MNTKWVWVGLLVFSGCLALVEPARADSISFPNLTPYLAESEDITLNVSGPAFSASR
jgi:hypothetical protein